MGDYNRALAKAAKLIEYYFSPESREINLFLRQHMNKEGWVLICLIADSRKIKQLVEEIPSIQFILDAVRASEVLETKHGMIRKRNDRMDWILPPTNSNRSRSSNWEGLKDRLQELSAMDKIEDTKMGFSKFTLELPIRIEEHDKQMVVEAMEVLRENLQDKCNDSRDKYSKAASLYSDVITELIDQHPDFLDKPFFQKLFSEGYRNRFTEFLGAKIAENKLKMLSKEPDEARLKVLQKMLVEDQSAALFRELLNYEQTIRSVKSFITIVGGRHRRTTENSC